MSKRSREAGFGGASPVKRSKYQLDLVTTEDAEYRKNLSRCIVQYFLRPEIAADGFAPLDNLWNFLKAEGAVAANETADKVSLRDNELHECLTYQVDPNTQVVYVRFRNAIENKASSEIDPMRLISEQQAKIGSLQTQLADAQAEAKAATCKMHDKMEELDLEIDKYKSLHREDCRTASDLALELESSKMEFESSKMEFEKTLKESKAKMETLTKELDEARKEINALGDSEEQVLRENADLKSNLMDMAAGSEAKDKLIKRMAEDLARQNDVKKRAEAEQLKALQDEYDAVLHRASETAEKIAALEKQKDVLQAHMQQAVSNNTEMKALLSEIEGKVKNLEQNINLLQGDNVKLYESYEKEVERNACMKEDLQAAQAALEEEKEARATFKTLAEQRAEFLEACESQRLLMQQRRDDAEHLAEEMKAEVEPLRAKAAKMESSLAHTQFELEAAEAAKAELEQENETLQEQLDEAEKKEQKDIREVLDLKTGQADWLPGRFGVFRMQPTEFWFGFIEKTTEEKDSVLVDIMWYEADEAAGIRPVNPAKYKLRQSKVCVDRLLCTLARPPNTSDQYEQLLLALEHVV